MNIEYDLLPLGSIVSLKGNTKKLMIISRAVALLQNDEPCYFDYGGCLYPEGLMGEKVAYFNHEGIQKIYFTGFSDEDEALFVETVTEVVKDIDFGKASEASGQEGQAAEKDKDREEGAGLPDNAASDNAAESSLAGKENVAEQANQDASRE